MKKKLIILAISTLVIPVFAQDTKQYRSKHDGERPEYRSEHQQKQRRHEPTAEEKAEYDERRLQFMKKSLEKIGVTEEQQTQIFELQKTHQKKMKEVSKQAGKARENLSRLQNEGATEADLDEAIDAIAEAQSAQLKILVRNRIEMEKILGKEKNAEFMENARSKFRQHGRRGGSGMPPRPDIDSEKLPPTPPKTPPTP
ncbi:MAG: hypothetical protein V3V05_04675 [Pontiella sp.]